MADTIKTISANGSKSTTLQDINFTMMYTPVIIYIK